jgi:hypothetical protein
MCKSKEVRKYLQDLNPGKHVIPYCECINRLCRCAFYERKWWKFWAPKGISVDEVEVLRLYEKS